MRVGDAAHGGGEFAGEVFAELDDRGDVFVDFVFGLVVVVWMVDFVELAVGVWVADCGHGWCLGGDGLVELFQAVECSAQMAVVEGVGVHLHEHGEQMQGEKDLCCPRPVSSERKTAPERDPAKLIERLDHDAASVPLQHTLAVLEQQMQRQAHARRRDHQQIAGCQLPDILREQRPLLEVQQAPRLFQIPQHSRDDHDRQPNPE